MFLEVRDYVSLIFESPAVLSTVPRHGYLWKKEHSQTLFPHAYIVAQSKSERKRKVLLMPALLWPASYWCLFSLRNSSLAAWVFIQGQWRHKIVGCLSWYLPVVRSKGTDIPSAMWIKGNECMTAKTKDGKDKKQLLHGGYPFCASWNNSLNISWPC